MAAGNDHVQQLERALAIKDRQLFEINKELSNTKQTLDFYKGTNEMLRESLVSLQSRVKNFMEGLQ